MPASNDQPDRRPNLRSNSPVLPSARGSVRGAIVRPADDETILCQELLSGRCDRMLMVASFERTILSLRRSGTRLTFELPIRLRDLLAVSCRIHVLSKVKPVRLRPERGLWLHFDL